MLTTADEESIVFGNFNILDELRKLVIRGDREQCLGLLESFDDDKEKFTLLYKASVRATVSLKRRLYMIRPLIKSDTLPWLNNLAQGHDFYEACFQIGIIKLLGNQSGEANHQALFKFVVSRLELLANHKISLKQLKVLFRVSPTISIPSLVDECSAGAIIALALASKTSPLPPSSFLESFAKWLSTTGSITMLEKPSLLTGSIGIVLNCLPVKDLQAHIVPGLQKLYLRSSRSCLLLLKNASIYEAVPVWILAALSSNGLTSNLITETDEIRALALNVANLANYWLHDSLNFATIMHGKPFKVKKDILTNILKSTFKIPDTLSAALEQLLKQEKNDDLRYLLASCIALNHPQCILETLKQETKVAGKLPLLAALCHAKSIEGTVLDYLRNYKIVEPEEQFLIAICLADTASSHLYLKNLTPACLSDKICRQFDRFEDLPIEKLALLLPNTPNVLARNIWKVLLLSAKPISLRNILNTRHGNFACEALASCLAEQNNSMSETDIKNSCLIAVNAMKSRLDLASLVKIAHISPYVHHNLYDLLACKQSQLKEHIDANEVYRIFTTINDLSTRIAFVTHFPECISKYLDELANDIKQGKDESSLKNQVAIVNIVVKKWPEIVEKHLDKLTVLWNASTMVQVELLYISLRSCSRPLGKLAPLVATMILSLTNRSQLIHKDWQVPPQRCFSLIIERLSLPTTLLASSFTFIFHPLFDSLACALETLSTEDIGNFLEYVIPLYYSRIQDNGLVEKSLKIFLELAKSKPRLNKLIQQAAAILCKTLSQASPCLLEAITWEDKLVRNLSLELIKDIPLNVNENWDERTIAILWVLQKESEAATILIQDLLKIQSTPFELILQLLNHSFGSWFDELLIVSICDFSLEASHHQLTIAKYGDLWNSRKPEILDPRNRDADLTATKRVLLARILKSWFETEQVDLNVFNAQLNFALDAGFTDTDEAVGEAILDSLLVSSRPFEASLKNDILKRLQTQKISTEKVRLYTIILQGALMQGRPSDDATFLQTIELIYEQLFVANSGFQPTIAKELVPLYAQCAVETRSHYFQDIIKRMHKTIEVKETRGAAIALAALVKGAGPFSIKQYEIMKTIITILDSKESSLPLKLGAIFCLDQLSQFLGPIFEPYVIALIPLLLKTLGDGRSDIRDALIAAAKSMMGCVSSVGAQLMMPDLLKMLSSSSWRSKVGSLQWLGTMANLSPRALSKQLPTIIPKVVVALSDSHHAVQSAAREALLRYALIVRNPEIKSLSQLIMDALADPAKYSEKFLDGMLHTAFAHIIDGPSMALINPILVRVLGDRTAGHTDAKKKAAQILANLATNLIDPRDLNYFLNDLIPPLKTCLSDPVPDVRSHSARVIGVLASTVGEGSSAMAQLDLQLQEMLTVADASSIDRAGAAQGYAELLAARGPEETSSILEQVIIPLLSSQYALQREGAVMLSGYLSAAFDLQGNLAELYHGAFQKAISPTILAMADENELVRDAAKLACHQIVARISRIDRVSLFDIMLKLLGHQKWKCRLGALHLFQEFLSKFSAQALTSEVITATVPTAEELQEGGIDKARVERLMSVVFLHRFDTSSSDIRHISLSIWKGLAGHPLRSLITILPTLIEVSCEHLRRLDAEQFGMVEDGLADLTSKIGDRIVGQLLEILQSQFHQDPEEITSLLIVRYSIPPMFSSGSSVSLTITAQKAIQSSLIDLINEALQSPTIDVRKAACKLLEALIAKTPLLNYEVIITKILEPILNELVSDEVLDPLMMDGLTSLLSINDRQELVRYTLVKIMEAWSNISSTQLMAKPLVILTCNVFDQLKGEASGFVVKYMRALLDNRPLFEEAAIKQVLKSLICSLEVDYDSPYQVSLAQLLEQYYSEGDSDAAFIIIECYLSLEDVDPERFMNIWPLRICSHINDSTAARACFLALLNHASGPYALDIATGITDSLTKVTKLSLACAELSGPLVKNLLVPMLLSSSSSNILAVDEERRRSGACKLVQLLSNRITSSMWGSNLTPLTGALIRICSDRQRMGAEEAYETLAMLLNDHLLLLKPFYPQIQRLFVLGLSSPMQNSCSVKALIKLGTHLSRPESLINSLTDLIKEEGEGQLAALTVLTQSKLVLPDEEIYEIAKNCMSCEKKEIRNVCGEWIEEIVQSSTVLEDLKQKLSPLLPLK